MEQLKRDLFRLKEHPVEEEFDALMVPLLTARVPPVQLDPELMKIITNYTLTDCCDELPALPHTMELLGLERQNPTLERFCRLLMDRLLSSLTLENFAQYLNAAHENRFENLKQGILRFALHNFDSLLMDPSVFLNEVRDPSLVAELFQLSRPWKDETLRRPLYPPIPPSTFLSDLKKLFTAGVDCLPSWDPPSEFYDDEQVADNLKGDCRLVVQCVRGEEEFMAHKCILVARSDFFEAAFLRDWSHEKKQNLVSLQHIANPISRDAMLAFLYFLYTASSVLVTKSNALDVLEILGSGSPTKDEPFGFLQVHGGYELWKVAEDAAIEGVHALDQAVRALTTADRVGSSVLRDRATEICIHYFDDFCKKHLPANNAMSDRAEAQIPSGVLLDICAKAFSVFGSHLPPPAIKESWEATTTSSPCDVSSLQSLDLSCGNRNGPHEGGLGRG
eukprot:GEMP01038185.1.p1 GENE.GEMP01038185.1~~GEMP01038185.1.p1  ORF type:complete len:448 (-),score=98.73 GEMP01038185.1:512-1855(-)